MEEALSGDHDREALRRRAADFAPGKAADRYLALLFPGPAVARCSRAGDRVMSNPRSMERI
jgi:hypothetical protein